MKANPRTNLQSNASGKFQERKAIYSVCWEFENNTRKYECARLHECKYVLKFGIAPVVIHLSYYLKMNLFCGLLKALLCMLSIVDSTRAVYNLRTLALSLKNVS